MQSCPKQIHSVSLNLNPPPKNTSSFTVHKSIIRNNRCHQNRLLSYCTNNNISKQQYSSNNNCLHKSFTQYLPSMARTFQIQKLKKKIFNNSVEPKVSVTQFHKYDYKDQCSSTQKNKDKLDTLQQSKVSKNNPQKMFNSTSKERNVRNGYQMKRESRQTRITDHQNIIFNNINSDEQFKNVYNTSFLIKQIKPQQKQRFTNQNPICYKREGNKIYGKVYGSYYQIVALDKKFHNSRYFSGDCHPQFFPQHAKADHLMMKRLQDRYYSRITGIRHHRGSVKYNDGHSVQPWRNQDHYFVNSSSDGFQHNGEHAIY